MTKVEKRIEKISQHPANVSPEELFSLLRSSGFECREGKGDHQIWKHPDLPGCLTIPTHKPLLPIYVKKALSLISLLTEVKEDD